MWRETTFATYKASNEVFTKAAIPLNIGLWMTHVTTVNKPLLPPTKAQLYEKGKARHRKLEMGNSKRYGSKHIFIRIS